MSAVACIHSPRDPTLVRQEDLVQMLRALDNRGGPGRLSYVDEEAGVALGLAPDHRASASLPESPHWYDDRAIAVAADGTIFAGAQGPCSLADLVAAPDAGLPGGRPDGLLAGLDGGFSLIGWSKAQRQLWLARDLLGLKPLYYAHRPESGLTVAASQLRGLLAHPAVARAVDRQGLSLFLTCGYATAPLSLVSGVRKVVPGELVEVDASGTLRTRLFRTLPPTVPEERDLEEWAALVRAGLADAVALNLADASRPGLLLSGGTDSIALAQVLAGRPEAGAEMLTVVYDSGRARPLEDALAAEAAARRLGLPHRMVRIAPGDLSPGWVRDAVRDYDEPISTADYAPTADLLARAALEAGVDVCLTGLQAEFLFGWKRWQSIAGDTVPGPPEPSPGIDRRFADRDRNLETAAIPELLADPIAEPDALLLELLERYASEVPTDDPYEAAVGTALRFRIPEAVLSLTERLGVRHGVDFRHPFGEARLLALASRIPSRHKGAGSRAAIKETLRAAFPWPSQTKGFLPPATRLRGEIELEREGLLSREALERGGVFHPGALVAIAEGRIHRPTRALWSMLVVQAWIHEYLTPLVDER